MNNIQELRLARWERIKQRGIWRFILIRGVLGWGLPGGILFSIFQIYSSKPLPFLWYFSVLIILGLWVVGGVFFGLFMWFITMWSYSRALKSKNRNTDNSLNP
jgi:uncharacterized BrkB/YihY/UPF0761 family membrane protein